VSILAHLSGGFDSAASTLKVANTGVTFRTLLINLGQPYLLQERKAAETFAGWLSEKYPNYLGHHELKVDMALSQQGQVSAYIPVRNLVIGAMSANFALATGCDTIAVGNKTLELRPEDPYCFNDCSLEFYTELGKLATFASQGQSVQFIMPLLDLVHDKWVEGVEIKKRVPMSKREVVLYVQEQGYDVRRLWSCYESSIRPCGKCHHCAELINAGVWDLVS